MKKIFSLGVIAVALMSLAGCNTVAGFGQDVQAGGKAITKTAEKVK